MKFRLWVVLLLIVTLCAGAALAEDRVIVATEDWEPPDLTDLDETSSPELLVLKVAQEEIGYTEGPLSNETKYGEWFCEGRVAWCAEFITWCVDQVDQRYGTSLMDDIFPYYGGYSTGAPFFEEKGRFISDTGTIPTTNMKQWLIGSDDYLEEDEYIPYPGDYIWFFYYSRKQGTDHVALVEGVSQNEDGSILIHVIEGNNPDSVQRATYDLTDSSIYGYGTPVQRAYSNLRLYIENDEVLALQNSLITLGYYEMEEGWEGYYTSAMVSAVKQLESDAGITIDGVYDMETYAVIEEMLEELGVSTDTEDDAEADEASETETADNTDAETDEEDTAETEETETTEDLTETEETEFAEDSDTATEEDSTDQTDADTDNETGTDDATDSDLDDQTETESQDDEASDSIPAYILAVEPDE